MTEPEQIAALRTALEAAARRFRQYEHGHAIKQTADGRAKAASNRQMAQMCEAALAAAPAQPAMPEPLGEGRPQGGRFIDPADVCVNGLTVNQICFLADYFEEQTGRKPQTIGSAPDARGGPEHPDWGKS